MGIQGKSPMLGLMQDWPLTLDKFIDHAKRWHPTREVVSRRADGRASRGAAMPKCMATPEALVRRPAGRWHPASATGSRPWR